MAIEDVQWSAISSPEVQKIVQQIKSQELYYKFESVAQHVV